MKRLVVLCLALSLALLAACTGSSAKEIGQDGEGPIVTVYKPPT